MLIETDIELAPRTTMGVGGRARWFARATHEDDVREALAFADGRGARVHVLGGGSNLVVGDRGVDGLVLAIALRGVQVRDTERGATVRACAGEPWDAFVERTITLGLSGLECLSGIPGLVGATPIQNVGAYGQEVADTIALVEAYDRKRGELVVLERGELEFSYRDSRFKSRDSGRFVVTAVTFELQRGAPRPIRYPELAKSLGALDRVPTLEDIRRAVIALRRAKSMVWDPEDENGRSCGSFFVNPTVTAEHASAIARRFDAEGMPRYPQPDGLMKLSAAWLIERSGFPRGTRAGNVGLSSRHALALVCHEGATAAEVRAFADRIREGVRERCDVELVPEPVFW